MCCAAVEQLSVWVPCHRPKHLQPRGLINSSNWCYVHAVSLMMGGRVLTGGGGGGRGECVVGKGWKCVVGWGGASLITCLAFEERVTSITGMELHQEVWLWVME